MSYRYRLKKNKVKHGMGYKWVECTEEEAKRVKRMRPNDFDIEERKEPEPTPSMKAPALPSKTDGPKTKTKKK